MEAERVTVNGIDYKIIASGIGVSYREVGEAATSRNVSPYFTTVPEDPWAVSGLTPTIRDKALGENQIV